MRTGFCGDEATTLLATLSLISVEVAEEGCFIGGRDVQDVEAMIVPQREVDGSFRRDDRGGVVADAGMIGECFAAVESVAIGADGRFFFAVGSDAECGLGEDTFERGLLIDEQVAGAGANEDFDAGGPFGLLKFSDIVGCRADIEAVVDDRLGRGQSELIMQRGNAGRVGLGVRHLQKRGDAPLRTGKRTSVEVFLVGEAGIAEVNLVVDDTGKQMQPGGVDRFINGHGARWIDGEDASVFNEDVARADTIGQHDLGVGDEGGHELSVVGD